MQASCFPRNSSGITAFTFMNFIMGVINIAASVVHNENNDNNNNNNNNSNNNNNVANINVANNNNANGNVNMVMLTPMNGRKRRSPQLPIDELSHIAMNIVTLYLQDCQGQGKYNANDGLEGLSPFGKTVLLKSISGFEKLLCDT